MGELRRRLAPLAAERHDVGVRFKGEGHTEMKIDWGRVKKADAVELRGLD